MKEELPDRYFYKRKDAIKIGKLLKGIIPEKKSYNVDLRLIREAWREIVGDEVYKSTEVRWLKDMILYVHAESATMIHHLTNFEKGAIISRINETMGRQYIRDIRFRSGMPKE